MKLLVGRFVLGCILAVLVQADVPADITTEKPVNLYPEQKQLATTAKISVVDVVTEKFIKTAPELTQRIALSEITENPDKNSKIFSTPNGKDNIEREIVVIHDQSGGGGGGGHHHDHGYHDHQGYNDHHHAHEHDYNHPPPPPRPPPQHHHDHHHPPPHHQHYPHQPYPSYYPPPHHYPPYSHGMSQPYPSAGIPPYPYYPPPMYYNNSPPIKPTATIIQTSSTTSSSGQNFPKPTDLLNQGTEYLWNLFGKLGTVTKENHEVVLINPKPVQVSVGSGQVLPPTWYPNKGKSISNNDCKNKNE